MRLVIDQPILSKTLSHVGGIVERRTTIPILANIRLDAAGGALTVTATDMDMEAVATIAMVIDRPGACTVPAQTLADIVKRLPPGCQVEMDLDAEAGRMTVRAGRSKFTLATLPVDDFPVFGAGAPDSSFDIEAKALAGLIDTTRFAISTEETRYYLNGIYLHPAPPGNPPSLRAVATDGHRLARAEAPLPHGAESMPAVIVPRKAVAEMRKLLDQAASVTIQVSPTKLVIDAGGVTLSTKLIDGTFPDYERVIPAGNDRHLTIAAAPLKAAIDRAAAISGEKTKAIKMCLSATEITIHASSPENGTAIETLEVEPGAWTGGDLEIGFNARYLMDVIDAAATDLLRLAMADAASPCIITDAAAAEPSALFVLMPMRV